MSSLQEFKKIQTVMTHESCRYFRLTIVNYCPTNLLSGSPPPLPPFPMSKYSAGIYKHSKGEGPSRNRVVVPAHQASHSKDPLQFKNSDSVYTLYRHCVAGRWWGGGGSVLALTFGIAFYQSNLSTGIALG
jgi:hypothetical protein